MSGRGQRERETERVCVKWGGAIDIKCSRAWLQRILKIETLDFNDDGTGEVGARVYYKKEK